MAADEEAGKALQTVAQAFRADLPAVFGETTAQVAAGPGEVVVVGPGGRARITWPFKLETEGVLGQRVRVLLEFLLASQTPHDFWPGYRPPAPERRRRVFDALRGYVDEVFAANPRFRPVGLHERGPAVLVVHGDEYAIVADDGHHKGEGILHRKVRRLVAYALTDAME